MKRIALAGLIVVAATVMLAPAGEARGHRSHARSGLHSRVIIGFGPAYYWGPPPYWYHPYDPYYPYYPRPYVVYTPPPVVVQEVPPVYIQQAPAPVPAPDVRSAEQFWYYCQSAGSYFPTVPSCPEAWVKVPPRP